MTQRRWNYAGEIVGLETRSALSNSSTVVIGDSHGLQANQTGREKRFFTR